MVGADADIFRHHGRRVTYGHVINVGPAINLQHAVLQPVIGHLTDDIATCDPGSSRCRRLEMRSYLARAMAAPALAASASKALDFGIGVKGLALLNTDSLHVETFERREHIRRLFIDQLRLASQKTR